MQGAATPSSVHMNVEPLSEENEKDGAAEFEGLTGLLVMLVTGGELSRVTVVVAPWKLICSFPALSVAMD